VRVHLERQRRLEPLIVDEEAETVMGTYVDPAEHVRAPAHAAETELDRPRLLALEPNRKTRRALDHLDPVRRLDDQLEPLDRVALDVQRQRDHVALQRPLAAHRRVDPDLRHLVEGE
jgi:hypothetical protein